MTNTYEKKTKHTIIKPAEQGIQTAQLVHVRQGWVEMRKDSWKGTHKKQREWTKRGYGIQHKKSDNNMKREIKQHSVLL